MGFKGILGNKNVRIVGFALARRTSGPTFTQPDPVTAFNKALSHRAFPGTSRADQNDAARAT
jgi:hypothetical protein